MSVDGGARRLLRRRVAALDAPDRPWAVSTGPAGLVQHVVPVLAARTGDPDEAGTGAAAALDPGVADDIVAGCRVLDDLGRARPELVVGPLRRDRQQWIGTHRHRPPAVSSFIGPAGPALMPSGAGLWTSTAGPEGRSPWREYLDPYLGSDLFPLPWTVWELDVLPSTRVREITSATEWANLLAEYGVPAGGTVHLDWPAVAAEYDAVHLTLRAVAAVQGIVLRTLAGPAGPVFWDVESTFWLRWSFRGAHPRERVAG